MLNVLNKELVQGLNPEQKHDIFLHESLVIQATWKIYIHFSHAANILYI